MKVVLPFALGIVLIIAGRLPAQTNAVTSAAPPASGQSMGQMSMPMGGGSSWHLMQDANLFLVLNHQGGERGSTEARAPNWWMGMASHPLGAGEVTFTGMFSLDPLTVGTSGYAELFQAGETFRGRPLVDRQHPHDLVMQFAAAYRVGIGKRAHVTIAGGPVGEPALGPIAFMHRPSAAGNPVAPLTHHLFDSTHISMGVVTAALDGGPVAVEASVFNGREPDEYRWNFMDPGPLDSVAARLWYRPTASWLFQVSSGRLVKPEALEPGNIWRTTANASWLRASDAGFAAVSAGYGRNDKTDETQNGAFLEGTRKTGRTEIYGRFEAIQSESDILLTRLVPGEGTPRRLDTVLGFTGGLVRDVARVRGFEIGLGADVTTYRVPPSLVPAYGAHPVSAHVFLQVRPPASSMGRMWNMTMTHLVDRMIAISPSQSLSPTLRRSK